MTFNVTSGSHPDFYILSIIGDLKNEYLFIMDDLHLNENRLIYVLVNKAEMSNRLPEGFVEALPTSFLVHPNIGHVACYAPSALLRITGYMVANITHMQKKITVHQRYDDAYKFIEQRIRESQSSMKKDA
jgi:hypothetical protein